MNNRAVASESRAFVGVGVLRQIALWASVIKFSHSVFALPFALSMLVILGTRYELGLTFYVGIVLAVVAARTAAMGFNRLADRSYDALNPRTASRELPAGKVTRGSVIALVVTSSAAFVGCSALLGMHCLVLAPTVLAVLFLYSLAKRFTALSHFILGFALAMAPGGVWYAVTGAPAIAPLYLMGAVLLWVSGFDVLYACQDIEFDRREALHSIPARLGVTHSFRLAQLLHFGSVVLLVIFGAVMQLGVLYFVGTGLFGLCIASQHRLVSPKDLSRMNAAFFTRNGIASVLFFLFVLADRWFLTIAKY